MLFRCWCLALLGLVLWPAAALAQPQPKTQPQLPPLPLSIAVATVDGQPVVSDKWVQQRVAEAERLMSPYGVHVAAVETRALEPQLATLDSAADRDALAAQLQPKVINVFVVDSLRDIDDRRFFIWGVRWRLRRNLSQSYVIIAKSAGSLTLAHELGHHLGNGHSSVLNNIMSYRRDDPSKVAFDARQGARLRLVAHQLILSQRVIPVPEKKAAEPPPAQAGQESR